MILTGRHLTASEMTSAGLITQTFFPGRLMEEVIPRMKRACSESNVGLQWNKLLLKQHQKSQVINKLVEPTYKVKLWGSVSGKEATCRICKTFCISICLRFCMFVF